MNNDHLIFILTGILGIPLLFLVQKYLTLKKEYFDKNKTPYTERDLYSLKFIEENDEESKKINRILKICIVYTIIWIFIQWYSF